MKEKVFFVIIDKEIPQEDRNLLSEAYGVDIIPQNDGFIKIIGRYRYVLEFLVESFYFQDIDMYSTVQSIKLFDKLN